MEQKKYLEIKSKKKKKKFCPFNKSQWGCFKVFDYWIDKNS